MSVEDFAIYAFAARLIERFVLTGLVLIIAIVVMVSFWRTLQKVDFKVSRDDIGASGTVVLATPVFMVLFLGGFAGIVLSYPINVNVTGLSEEVSEETEANAGASRQVALIGMSPSASITDVTALISDINCAEAAGEFSPALSDALRDLKLAQMQVVWQPDWGDSAAFRQWVMGSDVVLPDARASQVFFQRNLPC